VLIAAWSGAGVIKASSQFCLDAGGQKDFCQGWLGIMKWFAGRRSCKTAHVAIS
jgi:hypothetical protein